MPRMHEGAGGIGVSGEENKNEIGTRYDLLQKYVYVFYVILRRRVG